MALLFSGKTKLQILAHTFLCAEMCTFIHLASLKKSRCGLAIEDLASLGLTHLL